MASKPKSSGRDGLWFDESEADRAVRFFQECLRHSKGEWAGRPFVLEEWQRTIVRDVFGWKRADGTRRFRTVYIEIPRKNGKSTLAAGFALYLLFADDEPGVEVVSAAADARQAAIVFDVAKQMVLSSPLLAKRAKCYRRSISWLEKAALYEVISADADTKHGANLHGCIMDELHAQSSRDLFDVLATSTGARRQPLFISITTAGWDRNSICWEQHEYATRVLSGEIEDDTFYAAIWGAADDDDWTDPAVWAKSNPNLGVSIKEDYLAQECARARESPAYQNTFRRLHLNQWTQQNERWMDMAAWDACAAEVDTDRLKGRVCYAGLDLATSTDIAALSLVFPPTVDGGDYEVLPFFWIPAANMRERIHKDRVPYDAWTRDGLIEATPGNVIDFNRIIKRLIALRSEYQIREVAFDRWGAVQISQALMDEGFEMIQFGQGFASMSAPTKDLMTLVLERRLAHGGNPVLRWMADNLVVNMDAAGNLKPDKAKSTEKIDGMVALIMGLDRAMRNEAPVSAYSGGRSLVVA